MLHKRFFSIMKNQITITYCSKCRWLLRASWMGQELLTTFESEITDLTLRPDSGGIFEITANGKTIWSRETDGGFPEITELKRRVRDVIAPNRDLGHVDQKKNSQ
jgi:selenoprotein W-related protein